MKVLMFGWEFPPHISGGLGTACYGLTKGLAKNDVEVIFVVPKAWGDEDTNIARFVNASDVVNHTENSVLNEMWNNVSFMEIDSTIVPYIGEEDYAILHNETAVERQETIRKVFTDSFSFSGKYGKNLYEEVHRYGMLGGIIAKSQEFDVIHAHDWLTYAAGIEAKKATGKPLVCHIHATEFDRSGQDVNTIVYDLERKGLEAADLVIAVSNLTRATVIEKYGIAAEKVITVHNAVEPNEKEERLLIEKKVDEKIVTFLGRITFQKGPEYFVEAARKVLDKEPNVRFVMAGSGDLLQKIIKRVAQHHIADRFHFTGFLRGAEIDKLLAMSDVFVMPSVSEPFGIVPLEAMRNNAPVVISKQSGVAEVLNHALKVDFWDIDAMADAIYGLLNYKTLSDVFIKEGKEEVDNLKWEEASKKIKNVYELAIKK